MTLTQQIQNAVESAFSDTVERGENWHDARIEVKRGNELVITTRYAENPGLSLNGGDYFYYEIFKPEEGGVLQMSDWSAEFDRESFLGVDVFHQEATTIEAMERLAREHAAHLIHTKLRAADPSLPMEAE